MINKTLKANSILSFSQVMAIVPLLFFPAVIKYCSLSVSEFFFGFNLILTISSFHHIPMPGVVSSICL
jgi:hypothetical protein